MISRSLLTIARSRFQPWSFIAPLGLAIAPLAPVAAQTITATPDGTGTIIQQDGQTYRITGGTQAGENLFHSFQRLGLDAGAIAQFLSNSEITNILGRVTGGEVSQIDGLLQVVGSNANLYLMNPAGIVFGAGARLDVPGSFTATTADRIGFAGGWFNATGANDYAALTGAPRQFSFLQAAPGGIVNAGTLSAPGSVQLLGGTVANHGAIAGQQVTIAAVPGTSRVRISEPGMLLSVELERDAIAPAGLIRPVDLAQWLTGAAGTVANTGQIRGQTVDLMAATRVSTLDPELIRTADGYYPTVTLFPENLGDPWAVSLIDARVDDPYALLYGGTAGTISRVVGRDRNGLAAVQATLDRVAGPVDQLSIAAEGNQGNLWLGDTWLTAANVGDYRTQLQQWGEALTPEASLLLYSCFTALGATGEAFVDAIAASTGTAIAASTNATGSANYGGDWNLEYQTQPIQPRTPFRADTLSTWDGKLATQTVTSLANTGTGSLRDRIDVAASGDSIVFNVAGTIILNNPGGGADFSSLSIDSKTLTIDGGNQITIDGNQQDSIFYVSNSTLNLQNITLQNANMLGAQSGGGVSLINSTLTVDNSQISNNTVAQQGGGIFGNATSVITVRNSTITGNIAGGNGGGISSVNTAANAVTITNATLSNNRSNATGGGLAAANASLINSTLSGNIATTNGGGAAMTNTFTVRNSTIAFNQTTTSGGGIYLAPTTTNFTLTNSIVSQNIAPTGADITFSAGVFARSQVESNLIGTASGAGTLASTNLIGVDPLLGPLQNNGGSTQTHALLAGSPALDAGNNGLTTVTTDQLGNTRISNSRVDLGAFELQVTPTVSPPAPLPSAPQPEGCPPYCEDQDAERLIDPDTLNSEPSEGTSLFDPMVEELDSKASQDYADYYDLGEVNTPSLGEMQEMLQEVAAATGQDPAIAYFTFAPTEVETSDAMARSLLASSQLELFVPELAQVAQRNQAQSDELQLVVVTATGEPILKRVRGVTRSHVNMMAQRFTRSITRRGNTYWSVAQQLNALLIAPLEADLRDRGIDNLAIVADMGLRSIPFAALYDGDRFLVERYSLGLMPSVSLTNTDYHNIQDSTVLAMGASHFQGLSDLPAVPLELELVTASQGGAVFLNDAFTLDNLQRHREGYQVVHLGTHGEFRGGTAENSYLAMGRDRITLDQVRTLGLHNPPLELLVLSACRTALGDEAAELGFGGLAVKAGAKSVLGSLWYVSDAGTLGMMSQFYQQLHQAPIKAEALRQTQLAMLNGEIRFRDGILISGDRQTPLTPELAELGNVDFTHPFYWSAFTLIGSPW